MARVLISVLALNRLEATRRCLEAVLANCSGHEVRLVVTDNGSTDGTGEFLSQRSKEAKGMRMEVITETRNTGFIPPNDRAFRMAVEIEADYFIALNNDTVPPPGWLDVLFEPLEEGARTEVHAPVGGMEENAERLKGERLKETARTEVHAPVGAALSGPLGTCCALTESMHGTGSDAVYEYVEGSCLCAKVRAMMEFNAWAGRERDAFFSDYLEFIYGDDSDLSLRLREGGWTIHRVPLDMPHTRGETVMTQPEVEARCREAQAKNHTILRRRWGHYLRLRRFDYRIVVRRWYALGDVLLTTPVLRAIRQSFPLARIEVETSAPEIFDGNPNVDAASREVRRLPDDVEVDLNMAYENRPRLSILDAYCAVAHAALPGLRRVECNTELGEHRTSNIEHRSLGADADLCVLHAGPTDWPGKNWPLERFAEVAVRLRERGLNVVAVGTKDPTIEGVEWVETPSIGELARLLRSASLFVGIDSFPLHAAQAVGCPAVGLFGVTLPDLILPHMTRTVAVAASRKVPCAGARHREAGQTFVGCDAACIESVSVDAVMKAVGKVKG